MSETLNLGTNGNWATKKESLLAYNSENNNFKPLPFNFTRNSSATRVNKAGLIETVGSGEPRIDFKDNTKGALLLEPSRSNLVTQSEDLTQWTDYNASAVLSDETIYGKNAYKIVEDSTVNYHGIYLSNLFSADGTKYIWSVYVKGAERRYVVLTGRTGISSNDSALIFDTQDGNWVLDNSSQNQALSAESVGNGWWRISIEGNPTSGAYDSYTIASAIGFSTYLDANYQGDGTSGIYVAMPQVEAGSYPTSYIPTQGSIGTRVAESCSNGGNGQVINSTEGVLYLEAKVKTDTAFAANCISISNGTDANRLSIIMYGNINSIRASMNVGSVSQFDFNLPSGYSQEQYYKIAVSYKVNDCKIFINGTKILTDTSATMPSIGTFDRLNLDLGQGLYDFYGNVKDVKLYNTALTDQELINLTTI